MEDRSAPMRLKLLTPAGQTADVGCDSVVLILQDDREGRGGGKVGATLTELLSREGHNITLVDQKQDSVELICNQYDVMGVVGNGASYSVQQEAGIDDADLMIAVTGWYLRTLCPNLAPVIVYLLVAIAGFEGSFLLYEIMSRIPVIRWCVLGIKKEKKK